MLASLQQEQQMPPSIDDVMNQLNALEEGFRATEVRIGERIDRIGARIETFCDRLSELGVQIDRVGGQSGSSSSALDDTSTSMLALRLTVGQWAEQAELSMHQSPRRRRHARSSDVHSVSHTAQARRF